MQRRCAVFTAQRIRRKEPADRWTRLDGEAQNWALGYTWIISPRLVNQVTISLVRSASDGGQQITTGDPLTILAGTDQSQTGNGLDRADYIGSPRDKGNSPSNSRGGCSGVKHCMPWLDPSQFAKPAIGTYGNAGKGTWRGPTLWDVDIQTGIFRTARSAAHVPRSALSQGT